MKRLQLLIIFVVVGTILSGCVSPRPSQSAVSAEEAKEIAEEITRISEPRGTTVLTKDTAYLKSLWADDFSYIGADGTVRDDIAQKSGSKFAVENCHIKIKDNELSAHIWRFLYDVARQYRESIDEYGSKKNFEWTLVEGEPSILHVAKRPESEIPEKVDIPDYAQLLPDTIQKFIQSIEDADHLSLVQGGGHPHMVNEFLNALVENRDPWPNASCQLDVRRHLCPPKCRSKRRDYTITSAYPIKT